MEKVIQSQNLNGGAHFLPILPYLLHPQRLILVSPSQKEPQDPSLDPVQSQGLSPDQVSEVNLEFYVLCTLL